MSAVTDFVDSVFDTAGDVLDTAGDVVGGFVDGIMSGKSLDNIIMTAINPVWGAIYSTAEGVISGNPLQAIGGAVGLGGVDWTGGFATAMENGFQDSFFNQMFNAAPGGGYLSDLALQDFNDFGVEGVSALGDSLNYANGLDWSLANPTSVADLMGQSLDKNAALYQSGLESTFQDYLTNPNLGINDLTKNALADFQAQGYNIGNLGDVLKTDQFGNVEWGNFDLTGTKEFLGNTGDFNATFASNNASLGGTPFAANLNAGTYGTGDAAAFTPNQFGALDPNVSPTLANTGTSASVDQYGGLDEYGLPSNTNPTTPKLEGSTQGADSNFNMGEWPKQNLGGQGFQPQTYDYTNKDMFGKPTGTGWTFNPEETAIGQADNAFKNSSGAPFQFNQAQGDKGMFGDLAKLFKANANPISAGIKGIGAIDSVLQNRKAMKMMGPYAQRMMQQEADLGAANAQRGQTANNLWTENYTDPMAGYGTFMQGAGREFMDQARAQAAKSGRRGSYMNSGKMQSDLASLWAKNQLQRGNAISQGFSQGSPQAAMSAGTNYANMVRNQNAPIFDAVGNYMKNKSLASVFGGDE